MARDRDHHRSVALKASTQPSQGQADEMTALIEADTMTLPGVEHLGAGHIGADAQVQQVGVGVVSQPVERRPAHLKVHAAVDLQGPVVQRKTRVVTGSRQCSNVVE